jgi:hypothetical protein
MTIHVTVHDTRAAGGRRDWEVEVVKPKRGRVVRNESDETGHRVEFEVPVNSRQLVFQRRGGDRAEEVTSITLDLEPGEDNQEFELSDRASDDAGQETATRDDSDVTDTATDKDDQDVIVLDADADADADADTDADTDEDEDATYDGGLHDLAQHVNQELAKIWKAVEDLAYRVTLLKSGFADHLVLHESIPIPIPGEVPGEEPLTALEAADVVAVTATTQVRDGFLDAAETFADRLGLEPGADGSTTAGRTLEQLTLAANAANSAIAVYEAEPSRSRRNERLALVAFAGKVRTAGDFYADTIDHVAEVAARTPDLGERAVYTDILTTLRGAPTGPAVDQLRQFDVDQFDVGRATVGQAGARRTQRQGVAS